jgi:hypothetical protein
MDSDSIPITKRVRLLFSILIIGHLLALILPPLSVQTRGPAGQSPSVSTALEWVEPYSQLLYIDRGYAFFAPDPGPSHLIQVAITNPDGQRIERRYPDLDQQWPRLLYHRHFMLSEFLHEIYHPPGPPEELQNANPQEAKYWSLSRSRYERIRKSIIDHLRHEYPGDSVAIARIEHLLPNLLDYQQEPVELTDERLYRVLLDQPIREEAGE